MVMNFNLDNSLEEDWKVIYDRLVYEAPFVPGDEGEAADEPIPWLNPTLIKQGQDFVKANSFSINLAETGALLLGFSVTRLAAILIMNEKFVGISNSMRFYVETEQHVQDWYESKHFAKSFDDIAWVRKMHNRGLKKSLTTPLTMKISKPENERFLSEFLHAMKKDLEHIDTADQGSGVLDNDYLPDVYMSQFDMAATLFGFCCLVATCPTQLGIADTEGIEGFLHLWAVVGRLLGIQDRFNLALYPNRQLYLHIYRNIGLESLKRADLTIATMQWSLSEAVRSMRIFSSMKSSFCVALSMSNSQAAPHQQFHGRHLRKTMSCWDFSCMYLLQVILFLMVKSNTVRTFLNLIFKASTAKARKYVSEIKRSEKSKSRKVVSKNDFSRAAKKTSSHSGISEISSRFTVFFILIGFIALNISILIL